MAKDGLPQQQTNLSSYAIKALEEPIKVGDCVLMKAAEASKPYVARIERIVSHGRSPVMLHVRWYYRPEEAIGGRRPFHGLKELFLSDHFDIQSPETIEGLCRVHSFTSYMKIDGDGVGPDDYFCRFHYDSVTGAFNPDQVAVFCKCEMPYNPDNLMVQCEGCDDWFHPSCLEMDAEEIKKLKHFFCDECAAEEKKAFFSDAKVDSTLGRE